LTLILLPSRSWIDDCILLVSRPIFLGFHLPNLNYFPGSRCSHIYHPGYCVNRHHCRGFPNFGSRVASPSPRPHYRAHLQDYFYGILDHPGHCLSLKTHSLAKSNIVIIVGVSRLVVSIKLLRSSLSTLRRGWLRLRPVPTIRFHSHLHYKTIYNRFLLHRPATDGDGSVIKFLYKYFTKIFCCLHLQVLHQNPLLPSSSEPQPFAYFPGSRPTLSNSNSWGSRLWEHVR
jgi:hypothetical protein